MARASEVVQLLRIVRGEPSDEELAALIAVLAVLPDADEPPAPRSAWADPAHRLPELIWCPRTSSW